MRRFRGHPNIAGIMSYVEQWHPRLLEAVLKVGLTYAPIAVVMDITIPDVSRYAIAQTDQAELTDLEWVCHALSRFEAGWQIQEGILLSPEPSYLSDKTVLETIAAGRKTPASSLVGL